MAEERELILKLGQKITDRIGVKVTTKDPEYWGLAGVITCNGTTDCQKVRKKSGTHRRTFTGNERYRSYRI